VAGDRVWCFTDGHAVEAMTDFYESTEHLDRIDWVTIGARYWFNTEEDLDRKRRKQAEFLMHASVPWNWFHNIGVIDQSKAQQVQEIIAVADHRPEIVIEPEWYY